MARCNCSGTCTCSVVAGAGIKVTGAGAPNAPYVIEAEGGGAGGTGSTIPAGFIMAFAGQTVPAGWLVCDGSTISRGSYAALFAAIGTTWGAGDGSSTFSLPPLQGRGLFGVGGTIPQVGATGGSPTHTITIPQLPAHSHPHPHTHTINHDHANPANAGSHKHALQTTNIGKDEAGTNVNSLSRGTAGGSDTTGPVETTGNHTHNIPSYSGNSGSPSTPNTSQTGGNQSIPTMPPYAGILWAIKT
jgi:microcystin-dependent protein